MRLDCKPELAIHLRSNTQKARVISEAWFLEQGYCLNCSSGTLTQTKAGTQFLDFACAACSQGYELKSAARAHTKTVQDGGYDSMMRRVNAQEAPALMLMHYSQDWSVRGLVAIHPVFLTQAVIRKRAKPHIRPKTETEYWMCDLDLTCIPSDGLIPVVSNGSEIKQIIVRAAYQTSKRFGEIPLSKRGWTALVLAVIRRIGAKEFTSADMHRYAGEMHKVYPENNHVEAKVHQQLQVLRDLGYLEFLGRGEYRVLL